ncbi:MAG: ribonuclease R [Pirellulales bacterium]|nr:ribonuclease R [Pirellulales bacterium]
MPNEDLERALLALVLAPGYRPMKPRALAEQLGLSDDDRPMLKKLIKRLVKQGKIAYGANHLVGPGRPTGAAASKDGGLITGIFRRVERGFGFVRPAGTLPSVGRDADIFVREDRAGDAATGDTVRVRLAQGKNWRGKPEGTIVEVVQRETHQFVGTYFETAGTGYVQVDGTLFARPISVGDTGAKNVQPDDKVVFEMVRFPSHIHDGEGVITEVLGKRGEPGVDTQTIIYEYNLPDAFPDDVLEAARLEADQFNPDELQDRLDLTNETIITIDPIDARDFDDAISLVRIEKGHWRLGVHIADVSHFVRPKSALDREAYNRATSVYLPDRVLPMLPEVISNGLASLQPDRVRYTKTCYIEFTADGAPVAVDLHSAAIKSCRRFTYEEVDDYLADPEIWREKLIPEVHELLGRMHELAMTLRARRRRRGSLELSMPEVKVDLDKDGRVTGAHVVENTVSHQIIEEFMLSANEAVAETLHEAQFEFLRRVHTAPDPRKLKALTEFVKELGFEVESLESRFELQRLLEAVRELPEERAVNYAVLRSLQRAVYSPQVEGHFALASDCYCHFTSPIRRYPDLTIHRLIDALLAKRKPTQDANDLLIAGEHCSEREQRAEDAERELTKIKLLAYLSTRIGEAMDAVVTGVEDFGLFVQGIELPAEGLIHITSLEDDYYDFDRRSHTLSGRRAGNSFRLGDRVRVSVARVDVDRRELDFRLVARQKRPATRPAVDQRRGEVKHKPGRGSSHVGRPGAGKPNDRTGDRGKPHGGKKGKTKGQKNASNGSKNKSKGKRKRRPGR